MTRTVDIEISIRIAAPPEAVWPHLVDWERLGRWMKEGSGFHVVSAHRQGVGVEAEATIRIGGIATVDAIRVSRWEPPTLLEIEHRGWVKGRGIMHCLPDAGGTLLVWREELRPPLGSAGALGMHIWKPLMRRTFERDLAMLKDLAERERGTAPGQ